MQRMNPKMGWTEMFKEDGSRLDNGVSGFHSVDKATHCVNSMAHCYINATPKQVMGLFRDPRNSFAQSTELLRESYTSEEFVSQIPIPIPTISDRELLGRSVYLSGDGGGEQPCERCCEHRPSLHQTNSFTHSTQLRFRT
jgi:hypothetical protein